MNTTYKIPIEVNTTGNYTLLEPKEKLMAYAQMLVNTPKAPSSKKASSKTEHTEWVKNMAKYRVLQPVIK